jgi:peptide/nickel transport system substrate-binding protein
MERSKLLVFILLLVFLISLVGVSCTSTQPVASTTATTSALTSSIATTQPVASTTTPKTPTDSLKVGLLAPNLDTFLPWNGPGTRLTFLSMLYGNLTYIDPDPLKHQLTPGLATNWAMAADGSWTLSLRKGVQFNEGWGELTSADVKYTLERCMDSQSLSETAGTLRAEVDSIETPDPYTVVIHLKVKDAVFVINCFTDLNSAACIVCKKYIETVGEEKANSHPIGAGLYTLAEEHKAGMPLKLVTVPGIENHWRGTPEFQTVTFIPVTEAATLIAMLKAGELDMAPIGYDDVDIVKASGCHILSKAESWCTRLRFGGLVTIDPKRYDPNNPWAKKEVRQALNYAINREAICSSIFRGQAVPSSTVMISPLWKDIQPYPYDPVKAKQLLAQAGYSNGFSLTLKDMAVSVAQLPLVVQAAAMYWKDIGVDVKIEPVDSGSLLTAIRGNQANNIMWSQKGGWTYDLGMTINFDFTPSGMLCAYTTQESLDLANAIKSESNMDTRDQLLKQFGEFLRDEAPEVFVVNGKEIWGVSNKVGEWPGLPASQPNNFDRVTHPKS